MAFIGFLIYLFICLGIMFSPFLAIAAIERGREPDWIRKGRLERKRMAKERPPVSVDFDSWGTKEPTTPTRVDDA